MIILVVRLSYKEIKKKKKKRWTRSSRLLRAFVNFRTDFGNFGGAVSSTAYCRLCSMGSLVKWMGREGSVCKHFTESTRIVLHIKWYVIQDRIFIWKLYCKVIEILCGTLHHKCEAEPFESCMLILKTLCYNTTTPTAWNTGSWN